MHLITLFCLVALASGCITSTRQGPPPEPPYRPSTAPSTRPAYNLSGYSPAFKDGYVDGCETAKKTRYAQKDPRQFSADSQYRLGWNDGFGLCSRK